jgi:probable HAF family extracellular repeat protein
MVGDYSLTSSDLRSAVQGYVLSHGNFSTIDFPGGSMTFPSTINASNEIQGFYTDTSGAAHGFVLDHSTFTTIDFPGASDTLAQGINDSGKIVGGYVDTSGVEHGFLSTPAH